jgi:hypothetical protein
MADIVAEIRLRNPLVLITGGASTVNVTFPTSDSNWQFGVISNLSASAALVWTLGDNVMYTTEGMREVIYNSVTYYMVNEENIKFKEQIVIAP